MPTFNKIRAVIKMPNNYFKSIIFEEFLTPEELSYIENDIKITKSCRKRMLFSSFLQKIFKKLKNIIKF